MLRVQTNFKFLVRPVRSVGSGCQQLLQDRIVPTAALNLNLSRDTDEYPGYSRSGDNVKIKNVSGISGWSDAPNPFYQAKPESEDEDAEDADL